MRANWLDWLVVAAVGLLIVTAGGIGVSRARARAAEDPLREDGDAPGFFLSGAFGHGGDPSRAGVDPFRPPGLPEGVVIDRETGRMTGLELEVAPGTRHLQWAAIEGPDYERGDDDVPDSVKALADRPVVMVGFLKAIYSVENIRTFLLVGSHLACCFGTYPGPGGLVEVTLADEQPATERTVEPVVVRGRLRIAPLFTTYRGRRHTALVYYLEDASVRLLSDG